MTAEEELLEMKRKFDVLKEKKARTEGQLQEIMSRMKAKGFNSLEEAKDFIERTKKEIDTKQVAFEDGVKRLKDTYDW